MWLGGAIVHYNRGEKPDYNLHATCVFASCTLVFFICNVCITIVSLTSAIASKVLQLVYA